MRNGFTTGSCAAAASKAAAWMLFSGQEKKEITIMTPKGIPYTAAIEEIRREKGMVSCAVRKDGGDDPDITTGSLVFSEVRIWEETAGEVPNGRIGAGGPESQLVNITQYERRGKTDSEDELVDIIYTDKNAECDLNCSVVNITQNEGRGKTDSEDGLASSEAYSGENRLTGNANRAARIVIDGGTGVGRVTRPGLDQPIGSAAINHVPREMIEKEVREVCELFDFTGTLKITISVPDGIKLAKRTFNPRLGIEGGISILGTSGVVEPMSAQALLDTIKAELSVLSSEGRRICAISPGNYGQDYMKEAYGFDLDAAVKCSNFIGDTCEFVAEYGFTHILMCGHIGKFIKLYGGVFNTHSHEGDCRMELLTSAALRGGADGDCARRILSQISTSAGLTILKEAGLLEKTMEEVLRGVMDTLNRWALERYQVDCIIYENDFGELARSRGAKELVEKLVRGDKTEEDPEGNPEHHQDAYSQRQADPEKLVNITSNSPHDNSAKTCGDSEDVVNITLGQQPDHTLSEGDRTESIVNITSNSPHDNSTKTCGDSEDVVNITLGQQPDHTLSEGDRTESIVNITSSPSIICFTKEGLIMADRIAGILGNAKVYIKSKAFIPETGILVQKPLTAWVAERFATHSPIVFIGAIGIAVRGIAPSVENKLTDSTVIVADEKGHFVIPLLSGHYGGGIELSQKIAEGLGGEAVVTTATDTRGLFAVDVFARKNDLVISKKDGIKLVSSKLLEQGSITMQIDGGKILGNVPEEVHLKGADTILSPAFAERSPSASSDDRSGDTSQDYEHGQPEVFRPPYSYGADFSEGAGEAGTADTCCTIGAGSFSADVLVSVRAAAPPTVSGSNASAAGTTSGVHTGETADSADTAVPLLTLHPKALHLGIGCRKGVPADRIRKAVEEVLSEYGYAKASVAAVASADLKAEETGLIEFAKELGVPFTTYSAEELEAVPGEFTKSDFVRTKAGVDNVCERSAVRSSGNGKLLVRKQAKEGITVALAEADWAVKFT